MIKFLADENISKSLVEFLRNEGYNVKDIKEENLFGISDTEVFKLAQKEKRIILTHDKEFMGILRNPLKFKKIIIIRYSNQYPENVIKKFKIDFERIKEKIQNSVIIIYDKYVDVYEN